MSFLVRSLLFTINLHLYLFISVFLVDQGVWANDKQQNSTDSQLTTQQVITDQQVDRVGDLPQVSTTIKPLLAQEASSAAATKITGVKINPTTTGVEVVLEATTGIIAAQPPKTQGKILYFDIPNASLSLGDNKEFRVETPTKGIANIAVTQASPTFVRVQITGVEGVPTAEVATNELGLVITTMSAAAPMAAAQEEDEVEITVTGDRAIPYRVPNTSTGTRTDTPIRDIPQSIQIVPRKVLEDQKVIRLADVLRNVSGVVINNDFGGTADSFNIRGFDEAETLENGFKTGGSVSSSRDPANIEQIEVLKGPASVLYGNVEPGGVVNVVTKKPLAYPFYNAEFSLGSDSFYRAALDLSGPLTPDKNILYRLNLAYQKTGSFRDFVSGERIFVAPVLDFKLGDRTNLSVNATYAYNRRTLDRGIVANLADIPINRFLGEPGDLVNDEQFGIGYRLEHEFNDNFKIRNAFQFLQNNGTIFNANATELDEATGTLFRDYFDSFNRNSTYLMQTDLTSKFKTGSIEHQVLFGFDLQRDTTEGFFKTPSDAFDTSVVDRQTPSINIFNPIYSQRRPDLSSFIFRRDDRTQTDSLGIFVQDQITLADNLKLLIGGRFDTIRQDLDDRLNNSRNSESSEAFSPRVGIVYQPIPPISLYASYSRSFTPNAGVTAAGALLEPSRGTQYEAGIRAEINSQIAANLAFYEITKTNIPTTDSIDPAFSITVGEQRSRGIEFDISGQISPGWNVIASYSYTNAEISQSNDYPVGNKIPNVPSNKASLWTTYELQHGDLKGLGFGLGLFYTGSRAGDLENSFELPSYLRTDAAIYYQQNNWRAAINFQNLFNTRYFESVNLGRTTVIPGAPLTVIGSFAIQF